MTIEPPPIATFLIIVSLSIRSLLAMRPPTNPPTPVATPMLAYKVDSLIRLYLSKAFYSETTGVLGSRFSYWAV